MGKATGAISSVVYASLACCARCNGVGPGVVSVSRDGGSKGCGSSERRFRPGGSLGRSSAGSVNCRRRGGIVVGGESKTLQLHSETL
jgi:hypothetical protein